MASFSFCGPLSPLARSVFAPVAGIGLSATDAGGVAVSAITSAANASSEPESNKARAKRGFMVVTGSFLTIFSAAKTVWRLRISDRLFQVVAAPTARHPTRTLARGLNCKREIATLAPVVALTRELRLTGLFLVA